MRPSELVVRAQAGERRALRQLYHQYVDGVYCRLTRLLGPDPEREDLVQQIFAEVFRSLVRFRGDARFDTYLYRVATNVACDHLKRRSRRSWVATDHMEEAQCSSNPSPETVTIRRRELERVWRCIERLKPKKRIAYILRVVEGLSLDEIAAQVGARPNTVAQRVLHAQRELLAMMRRTEGGAR